jgi:hypothetical protein
MPPRQTDRKNFLVYIVESPSPQDLYYKRYEGEIISSVLSLAELSSSHKIAVNLSAFNYSLLSELQAYLKQPDALYPILHISAHGDSEGIQLTSGEVLRWNDLRTSIMPINKALEGTLILCMSSCESFNACRMAMSEEQNVPFLGMVGNVGKPIWSDTAIAFATFYHLLAKGHKFDDAVDAMKKASGNEGFMSITGKRAKDIFLEEINKIKMQTASETLRGHISQISKPTWANGAKE